MLIRQPAARRAATTVEMALVLSVFCLILFGVFEYCRFLYVLHVTNNAARDGARYAVVHMDKPSNFNYVDYTDAVGTVYPSVEKYTTNRMSVTKKQIVGYKVAAFAVDPAGLTLTPPVIRPKTKSSGSPPTYPDPFNHSDTNAVPWNQAIFTEGVAVTIQGTYKPLLPRFLSMPSSIPINVTVVAGSEG